MDNIVPWIRNTVCEGDAFPIADGWLSPCLQDLAVYVVLDLFLLLFGTYRLLYLLRHKEKLIDIPITNLHLFKCTLHALLILFFVAELALHGWRGTWGPSYEVAKDVGNMVVWILSGLVVNTEYHRGHRQNWILRVWWTLCFLGWSVTLKYTTVAAVHLPTLNFYLFIGQYALVTLVCIFGLFLNRIPVIVEEKGAHVRYGSFDGAALVRKYDVCDDDEIEGEDEFCGGPSKEIKANIFSKLLFWWVSALLGAGFKRPLQQTDLMDLHPQDESGYSSEKFQTIWETEKTKQKPSIKRALRRLVAGEFVVAGVFKLGNDVFIFTGPLVLHSVIIFLETPSDPMWVGVVWTCGLFIGSCIQSLCSNQYFYRGFRTGLHIRTSLIASVYQKSFKLTNSARQESTTGEIVNLQAIDSQKIADLLPFLHMVWSAPLQIAIATGWLVFILGPSALAGLGIMVLLIPFNIWLARTQGKLQKKIMKIKDSRAKLMNEVLNGIRVIKFFVWETSMSADINTIRLGELKNLRYSAFLRAGTIFLWTSTPMLVAVATFTAYALSGHELTPDVTFTALALFNILRFPLNMLPNVMSSMVEAGVSLGRIQNYLLNEELDPKATLFSEEAKDPAVSMKQGTFSWTQDSTLAPSLSNISFAVPKGELLAIISPVGTGKSSLMAALLGDIQKREGAVEVYGSVAYVSQQAWIQNATLRDNILFGTEFNEQKYIATLHACELLQDIEILPDGDLTEIGEKGINLSGGQKQRVNCARAVYQMADVYLFDDPLSAVDAHVGRNIFTNCIKGTLQGKTRILVTHQLHYLSEVDKILVLKQTPHGSTIAAYGTYTELMASSTEFAQMIHDHVTNRTDQTNTATVPANVQVNSQGSSVNAQGAQIAPVQKVNPQKVAKNPPKKLMTVEKRRVGHIGASIYRQYLSAFPGGISVALIILLLFMCAQASSVGSNIWLANWSNNGAAAANNVLYYLGIYAALGLSSPLFVITRSFLVAFCGLSAAQTFHANMLRSAMRAPVSFYDTTPIGRILNRFTKDIADVDQMVPPTLMQFLDMAFSVLGTMVVISLATPWFLVPLVPLAFFYRYIQKYYVRSSRELKRLDSISKSPIFAHFSETLSGLSIIRAYKRITTFVQDNERKLNENAKAYFALFAANRWLAIRLEFIGYSVVTLAAFFAVFGRGSVNAGLAGLAMSYSLSLTGLLNMAVRQSAAVENQLVSVERVMEYTALPSEAPETSSRNVPDDWPSQGRISFENFSMRYRPDLPLVLKHVDFTVQPQEKIGIVGRTGSGKSSTALALFRIVEPAEGNIVIDGVNIHTLGLNDARSRLSIIPQDPVLFTGTVRTNVDPTRSYSDNEIWKALESVHMLHAVEALPMKIDSPVTECGENFSVGQRQLLCLARALLKKSKIIIMDEATAAVDMQTDSLIQTTVRTQFADMTVLTIAHRIHTILDYDRIVVMEGGEVIEMDSPKHLLANPHSVFYSLVQESQHSI